MRRPSPKRSAFSKVPRAELTADRVPGVASLESGRLDLPQVAVEAPRLDDVFRPFGLSQALQPARRAERRAPVDLQHLAFAGRGELGLVPAQLRQRRDREAVRRDGPGLAAAPDRL